MIRTLCGRVIGLCVGTALLTMPALVVTSTTANAASFPCTARVDIQHPTDYSTVTVSIHTKGNARITTTAHYRTTSTVKTAIASASGSALIAYRISRATSRFTVVITVSTRLGAASGACRTSFTPV